MGDVLITSRQNEAVKHIRTLRDKKHREDEKLFLVEGAKMIKEALESGYVPVRIFISEKAQRNEKNIQLLSEIGTATQIFRVHDQIMEYISETKAPQGLIALLRIPEHALDDIRIDENALILVLDGIQDPGNLGTIIRTADAFGARAVIAMQGCADLYNGKTIRSTMGSLFHLPVVRDVTPEALFAFLQRHKIHTLAAHLASDAVHLTDMKLPRPLAIIMGNEGAGVSDRLLAGCDGKVKIPMAGLAESLNVASSAAVILYEAFRQYGYNPNETCK